MAASAFYPIIPLTLCAFTATLDNNILNICLPLIAEEIGGDVGLAQFVASAYTFTICGLLLVFACISSAFGRRNVFSGGMILFAAGSILAAYTSGLGQLILSRVVQGIGAAMYMANGMALLNTHFDSGFKGRAFGIMSSAIAVASMTGPVLGGIITAYFGWRAIFYAFIPLALAAAISAQAYLQPEKPVNIGRVNGRGMVTSSFSILVFFCSFLFFQQQQVLAFIAMLGASFGAAYYFFMAERTADNPLLGKGLLANRVFVRANISAASVYAVMLGCNLVLPFFALNTLSLSVVETGWLMAVSAGAIFALSYYGGKLADRRGGPVAVRAGLLLLAAGMLLLAAGVHFTCVSIIGLANAVFGAGIGIFNPANNKIVMESVPLEQGAAAASINILGRNAGIAVGTTLGGIIYAALLSAGYGCPTAVLLIIGVLLAPIGGLLIMHAKSDTGVVVTRSGAE